MQAINKKGTDTFTRQDLTVFETLASQCAIAIENACLTEMQIQAKLMERELEIARDIQQKTLPLQLPDYNDLDVAAQLIPARLVGGDYYNMVRLNDNESLFLVADVSGKGFPAALIVSTIHSCLLTFLTVENCFEMMRFIKKPEQGVNRYHNPREICNLLAWCLPE